MLHSAPFSPALRQAVEMPPVRPRAIDVSLKRSFADPIQIVAPTGLHIRIAARNQRTTPEVQQLLPVLVAGLDFERHQSRGRPPWSHSRLAQSHHAGRAAE